MTGKAVLLNSQDNVVTACCFITSGQRVVFSGRSLNATQDIPAGHKMACHRIANGEGVTKYGVRIGTTTKAIGAGEHVHLHNMKSDYIAAFTRRTGSTS